SLQRSISDQDKISQKKSLSSHESDLIRELWCSALGYEDIDNDVNFFDLGGDSLIASGIIAELNEKLDIQLSPSLIYNYSTINDLKSKIKGYVATPTLIDNSPEEEIIQIDRSVLSTQQKRLLFLHEYDVEKKKYNLVHIITSTGKIDINILTEAMNIFFKEQEAFSTYFSRISGVGIMKYADDVNVPINIIHYNNCSERIGLEIFSEHIKEEVQKVMDLYSYPLCKVEIHKLSDMDTQIALYTPHIISDGWSAEIFRRQLWKYYNLLKEDKSIISTGTFCYSDYVKWEQRKKQNQDVDNNKKFWRQKLDDIPSCHTIPLDKDRKSDLSGSGDTVSFSLTEELSKRIRVYCRDVKITPYNFFLGILSILIWKYSGQDTVVIGSPYANREKTTFKDIVGFFVKTLPLKISFDDQNGISQYFQYVKATFEEAWSHSDIELDEIIELCKTERIPGVNPIFQIVFAYQNFTDNRIEDDCSFQLGFPNRGISEFDISLYMREDIVFEGGFEFSTDIFCTTTIERMLLNFKSIIESILERPNVKMNSISIMRSADWEMLKDVNDTESKEYLDKHFLDLYEESLQKYGNNIAIEFQEEVMTYSQLHRRTLDIAKSLKEKGVRAGDVVAVFLNRGPDLIASMLAVYWVGGQYLPIDPRVPSERMKSILEDAVPQVVLVDDRSIFNLDENRTVSILNLKDIDSSTGIVFSQIEPVKYEIAYIIYTSGSTGKPKGALITHTGLANTLLYMNSKLGLKQGEKFLALTSASFDLSLIEFCLPFLQGSSILMVDQYTAMDGMALSEVINSKSITFIQATPTTWNIIRDAGWKGNNNIIAISGGEALDNSLSSYIRQNTRLAYNGYGPTETAIYSSFSQITDDEWEPNIGFPNANEEYYVVDKAKKIVPQGISGELYIGGASLAAGYLNRDQLTSEKFIQIDFDNGSPARKLYRTGDVVKQLSSGAFVYIGRTDQQIKMRGYRIELGEIEKEFNFIPEIIESICIVSDLVPKNPELILFYRGTKKLSHLELNQLTKNRLPEYMIPKKYVYMEEFPKTLSGKIDRKKLKIPETTFLIDNLREIVSPRNHLERMAVEIWQDVLQIPDIGIRDNFFELGGHSLLTTKLIDMMNEKLHKKIKLRDLFIHPTIEELLSLNNFSYNSSDIPLIFPVSQNGGKTPFFLVAGAYVNSYKNENGQSNYEQDFFRYFSNIIRIFQNERPLFGLRPQGVLKGEDFHQNVQEMAKEYVLEIKKIQPSGPYIIGGECVGGNVAYEIVQQLKADGENVKALILLDTVRNIKDYEWRFKSHNNKQRNRKIVKNFSADIRSSFRNKEFDQIVKHINNIRKIYLPIGRKDRMYSKKTLESWVYAETLAKYKPERYTGKVILLINEEWNSNNPSLSWDSKICPNLSSYEIPGNHRTRLGNENLDYIGSILQRELSDYQ
ncbi:MAG: amino acid adenylation domain-containing protein, partial [Spirochaetaceae bacterium]|nr:amino acid adenylation domain-containing protein [Spirochaetaceae bacterium]